MTNDEWNAQNHKYLADFVKDTEVDHGDMTGIVKATIVQFLMNLKRNFNLTASKSQGYLTREELIECQIEELRRCIIDLQSLLTTKESTQ